MRNMNRVVFCIVCFLLSAIHVKAEKSPHEKELTIDCSVCHVTSDWKTQKENGFNHQNTRFPLKGEHQRVSCKECHTGLRFKNQKSNCVDCHTDVHEKTLGSDCERCHNETSWLITNVSRLHREAGFPLVGVHTTIDCNACHVNVNDLKFNRMRTDCYSCHQQDYNATTSPNHRALGYTTDCLNCHSQSARQWNGTGIDHSFFPLNGGHAIDCTQCHSSGFTAKLSTDCYSCHQTDYERTSNPSHASSGFAKDCASCHTIKAWAPATFDHDKLYFPIYSGTHRGEWSQCTDCHTNTSNYKVFSCTDCHEHSKSRMDKEHDDVRNYVYNSVNCLSCHPRGKAD